jgi:sulfoxide reductase heme-binding subunit YedZ
MALVLLTATVVLGVAGTARFATPRWPRMLTSGLHRNLSLLSVAFVAAHVLTTVLDSYAPIGLVSAVVPFSSPYRTFWLGLGTIAFDLLLAVVITSLLRVRLGYRAWRAVHWLGYACWPIALWHGLGTGTDSRLSWLLALDAICVAAVAGAVFWRLSLAGNAPGVVTRLVLCAAVPVATAVFVVAGPLQPGWARRSGTPQALLAGGVPPGTSTAPVVPADASFTGHATRSQAPQAGQITITVAAMTSGAAARRLVITLRGAPDGAGVSLSKGTVILSTTGTLSTAGSLSTTGTRGDAGASPSYQGPVVRLDGQSLVADLHGPDSSAVRVTITLVIRGAAATGQLVVAGGGR